MSTRDFWYMWLGYFGEKKFCSDSIALHFALCRHCEEMGLLGKGDTVFFLRECKECFDKSELLFEMAQNYISKQIGDKKEIFVSLMEHIEHGYCIREETPEWWLLLDSLGSYWNEQKDQYKIAEALFCGGESASGMWEVALDILQNLKEDIFNNSNK